jgi:hypothetical protein
MEIRVTFVGGKLIFSPDPARVQRGEPVSWSFEALDHLTIPQLRWTVYFSKGSPFREQGSEFITDTPTIEGGQVGTSAAMSAYDPGNYKYGVRVVDPLNRDTLGDDDPVLIVLP